MSFFGFFLEAYLLQKEFPLVGQEVSELNGLVSGLPIRAQAAGF